MTTLSILYRDDWLVAVDKPAGLLVHRTALAEAEDFALQRVRSLVGHRVYSIHRLDRPTSGLLLYGVNREAAAAISREFEERRVEKRYLALVRGWPQPQGTIDHPLTGASGGTARPAATRFRVLARVELPVAVGRYPTSRYALMEVAPLTGRYHQIRRHFHHIFHPIVGDTTHGEGRHNRFFRDHFGVHRLLLHAASLTFTHPGTDERLQLRAPLDPQWMDLLTRLDWKEPGGDAFRRGIE